MRAIRALRYGAAALVLGGVAIVGVGMSAPAAESQSSVPADGQLGFVISAFSFGMSTSRDANTVCPGGLSVGPTDIYAATPEGQRHEGESDADYSRRLQRGSAAMLRASDGQNLCMHPELGAPDPHHPLVQANVQTVGIDLDGQRSRANGRAAPGTCAHDDFAGADGVRNIDNQFLRALGCTGTFSAASDNSNLATSMLTGEWGVLITLDDVQSLRNDNSVTVHFYANNDPIQLSGDRQPLVNATYARKRDPRYIAETRARIVNGVLTTDPVDVRFPYVVNAMHLDRELRDARLRVTMTADGAMEGFLSGYTPIDNAYDNFGFRHGRDANGQLSRSRQYSASGYASTARHTCNGIYYALQQVADGHRDPATGRCTSVSTQYRVRAIPAFVVDAATQSANEDLVSTSTRRTEPDVPPPVGPVSSRTLGELMGNPATLAVLRRHLPELMANEGIEQAGDFTVLDLAQYVPTLTPAKLVEINNDLIAALPAQ